MIDTNIIDNYKSTLCFKCIDEIEPISFHLICFLNIQLSMYGLQSAYNIGEKPSPTNVDLKLYTLHKHRHSTR